MPAVTEASTAAMIWDRVASSARAHRALTDFSTLKVTSWPTTTVGGLRRAMNARSSVPETVVLDDFSKWPNAHRFPVGSACGTRQCVSYPGVSGGEVGIVASGRRRDDGDRSFRGADRGR